MKKWYLALLAIALPLLSISFASCDDDKDLPNVDISLDISKGTVVDDVIYVVQGDTLKVAAIDIKNNEAGKGAAITNVNYYWNGYYYAPSMFAPFGMTFPTTIDTPVGDYTMGISCTVLAVDKSIATVALSYSVKVVANETDIPGAPEDPEIVRTVSLNQ